VPGPKKLVTLPFLSEEEALALLPPPALGLNADTAASGSTRKLLDETAEGIAVGHIDDLRLGRPWAAWHKGSGRELRVIVIMPLPEGWDDRTKAAWRSSINGVWNADAWLLALLLQRKRHGPEWETIEFAARYVSRDETPSITGVTEALRGEPRIIAYEAAEAMWQMAYGDRLPRHLAETLNSWRLDSRAKENRRRDDPEYVALAARYAALARTGQPAVAELARQLGKSSVHIRDALREARRRNLLTEAANGRASGQLTPHGRQVLRDVLNGVTSRRDGP
jgi:hypothetical protein